MRGETCQNSTIGEPFSVRLEDARFVKRWRVSTSGEACRIVAFREVEVCFNEWRGVSRR